MDPLQISRQKLLEYKDVFVLGGIDEVQALLDDSMATISTIMASRYVGGIRSEVEKMEANVRMMQEVLDEKFSKVSKEISDMRKDMKHHEKSISKASSLASCNA